MSGFAIANQLDTLEPTEPTHPKKCHRISDLFFLLDMSITARNAKLGKKLFLEAYSVSASNSSIQTAISYKFDSDSNTNNSDDNLSTGSVSSEEPTFVRMSSNSTCHSSDDAEAVSEADEASEIIISRPPSRISV